MSTLTALAFALVATYAVLLTVLLIGSPDRGTVRESVRILPDLLRLVGRLARSAAVPRGPRAGLWLLLGYIAMPFDIVPDILPVIGFADDVILAGLALRWVLRRTSAEVVRAAWPGSPDGLRALRALTRTAI